MFKLGSHFFNKNQAPMIVAELSGNHQQQYDIAEKMIDAAARSGAHAVKLQTYTADTMTFDSDKQDFVIQESSSLWHGEKLYNLYARAATPWEWHKPLFKKAEALGLLAFSSPFDETAVDFLEDLNVPCYKIASFENTDIPLIKKVAATGKPVIISTGMATETEIEEAVETVREEGNQQIILLKCTSNYPADFSDANLTTIGHMQHRFDLPVGLSDHSQGLYVAMAATALGACMIEKHFVLDRSAGGVDAEFSLEADELTELVNATRLIHQSLGNITYGGTQNEQSSKKYRRSIYVDRNIKNGEKIEKKHIRIIRPGFGLEPKYYWQVIGKKVNQDLSEGTPLSWDHIVKD